MTGLPHALDHGHISPFRLHGPLAAADNTKRPHTAGIFQYWHLNFLIKFNKEGGNLNDNQIEMLQVRGKLLLNDSQ